MSALFTSVEAPLRGSPRESSSSAAADSSDVMTTEQEGELDQQSPSPPQSEASWNVWSVFWARELLFCSVKDKLRQGHHLPLSDKSVADTSTMISQSKEVDKVQYHTRCA
eukprot:scaffold854_cov95-Skeletonema_dohrnii-CCMP3373.AAC.6